jgi:hypothetical protein
MLCDFTHFQSPPPPTKHTRSRGHSMTILEQIESDLEAKFYKLQIFNSKYWTRYRIEDHLIEHVLFKRQQNYFHQKKSRSTWCSQAVSHPSTIQPQRCLTSVVWREPVRCTWYGRYDRINIHEYGCPVGNSLSWRLVNWTLDGRVKERSSRCVAVDLQRGGRGRQKVCVLKKEMQFKDAMLRSPAKTVISMIAKPSGFNNRYNNFTFFATAFGQERLAG